MRTDWNLRLRAAELEVTGPLDPPDSSVNGDPDSTVGEDDEAGFDEMPGWPEEG